METMPPFRRKRLRLADFNYADPNYIYFATICARYPTRPFLNDALAQEVIKAIHWSREHQRWVVYCYCLMPDHLHLVLSPGPAGMSLSECFRAFKRWTTRKAWEHGVHGRLWQRSWYDHIARCEPTAHRLLPDRQRIVHLLNLWNRQRIVHFGVRLTDIACILPLGSRQQLRGGISWATN